MADNHSVKPGEGGIIKELNPNDVLTGRGPSSYSHPGNVLFRRLCLQKWQSYANSRPKRSGEKKVPKKILMAEVVTYFRNMNPPGRFLHHNEEDGHWIEIGDKKAIEKAVYLLRGTDLSPDGNGTSIKNDADSPRQSLTSAQSASSAQSTAKSVIGSERMSMYHQLRNERAFGPTLPTTFDLENTAVDIEELMTSSIGEWDEDDQEERRVNNHTRGDVTTDEVVAETTPGRVTSEQEHSGEG